MILLYFQVLAQDLGNFPRTICSTWKKGEYVILRKNVKLEKVESFFGHGFALKMAELSTHVIMVTEDFQ